MLQLENRTPFAANIALMPDRDGVDTVYVIVKATLTLRPRLALAAEQIPVTLADEYHGDPTTSSLRLVSELHIGKPGTDVLITGPACAPGEKPVTRMRVEASIAGRVQQILVSGDRHWESDGTPSSPAPFVIMPLSWERSYGGVHRSGDVVLAEERNPVGIGFAGSRTAREMHGQPVPNLEDPGAPLQQVGDASVPVCFAPAAASWLPRRAFAGTYDEAWQRTRAPYLPSDFDPRFLNCAAGAFAFDRYLVGGEPINISGMTPDAPIAFALPAGPLQVQALVAGSRQRPASHLETVLIEPAENRLCMTWRAAIPCNRQALKVEKIIVEMTARSPA